ncbi:hypothetical protein LOC68_22100 [Blastopirellula sp. JC732]|uniref:DUF4261 domain-containing protein n=1 Tax=Blastopirellula sediminis TaxID=2894196 RepID=A0A9X1SI22_9BACT|nr:hypothetical protein [Blastopirellula sediminis]MCC9605607.1 hypothetical protein [Blastopirellula sediminis]MCC9631093.1 hypothetical protein [Blastopirellula sediminis]
MSSPDRLPETVICIPGPWATRNDLIMTVGKYSGGYLYAGVAMMHMESRASFTVQFEERNPRMAAAFAAVGKDWLDEKTLAQIDAHRSCVYLIANGGSEEAAKNIMQAAAALLKCGGIAVKIESSGVAHSAAKWTDMAANPHRMNLYWAYVVFVGNINDGYYSCGMHNIGYPDCVMDAGIDSQSAAKTIDAFLKYMLLEEPVLHSGENFRTEEDAPSYEISREECRRFPPGDLYYNPYGVWKLTPAI